MPKVTAKTSTPKRRREKLAKAVQKALDACCDRVLVVYAQDAASIYYEGPSGALAKTTESQAS